MTRDAASVAVYALNYSVGNFRAKGACQRDNIGQPRMVFPNTNTKINLPAEDVKFETDKFRAAVATATRSHRSTHNHFQKVFSH